jgi:hypothetical protein
LIFEIMETVAMTEVAAARRILLAYVCGVSGFRLTTMGPVFLVCGS